MQLMPVIESPPLPMSNPDTTVVPTTSPKSKSSNVLTDEPTTVQPTAVPTTTIEVTDEPIW